MIRPFGSRFAYVCCMNSIFNRVTFKISFLILVSTSAVAGAAIDDYTPVFQSCMPASTQEQPRARGQSRDQERLIAIRHFRNHGQSVVLAVNPNSLATQIVNSSSLTNCGPVDASFENTNYAKLLKSSRDNDSQRSNAGVTHSPTSSALFLTVDLCPSSHTYESAFFNWVGANHVPLAISISGNWISHHEAELNAIKNLQTNIVWVNHTLTHPYNRHLPDEHNFLLLPGVDVTNEVLGNERMMIENGLTPSIFLRFPGLISDRHIADQVNSWGLVALGANAWLALGQTAKPGSIILVHGNGNETPGIHLFMASAHQFLKTGFESLTNFIKK